MTKIINWLGKEHVQLSDLDKKIFYHEHEANRCRFFGMMTEQEHHLWMAESLKRMKEYNERTITNWKDAVRSGLKGRVQDLDGQSGRLAGPGDAWQAGWKVTN